MGAVREPGNRAPSTVPARPGPRNPSRRVLSAPPCGRGVGRGEDPRVAGRDGPSRPGAAPGRGAPSAAGRAGRPGVAAHTGEATAHSKLWRAQQDRRGASACAGTRPAPRAQARHPAQGVPAAAGRAVPPGRAAHARDATARSRPGAAGPTTAARPRAQGHDRPLALRRDTPRGASRQRPAGPSRRAWRRTPGTPQRVHGPAPPARPPQRVRVRRDTTGPSRSGATPRAGRPGSDRPGRPAGQSGARPGRHSAFTSRRRRVRPPRRTSCPPPGRGRGGNRV